MAIVTLDNAIAGMMAPVEFIKALSGTLVAGRPFTPLYTAGIPGAAAAPSPGIDGEAVTSFSGQLPFSNPVSGNTYLARFQAQATQAGSLLLCDRLWHNSGITINSSSEQNIASAQIPPRDSQGTNNGVGVYAGIEVSTVTGAGTPTLTLKYTNSSGTENKISTNIIPTVATSGIGSFYPIGLDAGDIGIRKAQSITLSATWTSGVIHVVLYRIIARLELLINTGNAVDILTGGFPRLHDNSTPFLIFIPNTTTTSNIMGHAIYTQG